MLKKTLSLLVVLMLGFSVNALAEEQEVQNTQQEKKTIELPQWVKNIKFSAAYIFPYSNRTGTAADKMPNQIPFRTRKARATKLVEIMRKMS